MKPLILSLVAAIACATLINFVDATAAGCAPQGDVQWICGPLNAEDLVQVPQTDWVIASSFGSPGGINLIHARDQTFSSLYPSATAQQRFDRKTYDSCPGPLEPPAKDNFRAHGLNLRAGKSGIHTLYVVHHGARESVEVFEINARQKVPALVWVGCAVAPQAVGANSVAALPDGGFVLTNFGAPGDPDRLSKMAAGRNTGELWEWHSGVGWTRVAGSETAGPNGLEVSKDGKWYYIGVWGSQQLMRLSRGQGSVKKDAVNVSFHIDNVRWQPDGSLLVAGQGGTVTGVLRDCLGPQRKCSDVFTGVANVDPSTLKAEELIHYPSNEVFIAGTVGLTVGKEIWVGTVRGDRIARFAVAKTGKH